MRQSMYPLALLVIFCGTQQIAAGAPFPEDHVRHYPFDEGSGTVAHNHAASGQDLVVSDSWTSAGKFNAAYNPNGNFYDSNLNFAGDTGATVNFWLKKTADWGIYNDIIGTGNTADGTFYIDTDNPSIFAYLRQNVTGNFNFPTDGNWHMITLVINDGTSGGIAHGYTDGNIQFTRALGSSWLFTSATLKLFGGIGNSPNNLMHVDDVGVWNRALSSQEVAALFPEPTAAAVLLLPILFHRRCRVSILPR